VNISDAIKKDKYFEGELLNNYNDKRVKVELLPL